MVTNHDGLACCMWISLAHQVLGGTTASERAVLDHMEILVQLLLRCLMLFWLATASRWMMTQGRRLETP